MCVCVSCLLFICGSLIPNLIIFYVPTEFNIIWDDHIGIGCVFNIIQLSTRQISSPPWPGEEFQASDLEDFVEARPLVGNRRHID